VGTIGGKPVETGTPTGCCSIAVVTSAIEDPETMGGLFASVNCSIKGLNAERNFPKEASKRDSNRLHAWPQKLW
jgi:hypothetical protein